MASETLENQTRKIIQSIKISRSEDVVETVRNHVSAQQLLRSIELFEPEEAEIIANNAKPIPRDRFHAARLMLGRHTVNKLTETATELGHQLAAKRFAERLKELAEDDPVKLKYLARHAPDSPFVAYPVLNLFENPTASFVDDLRRRREAMDRDGKEPSCSRA